MNPLVTRSALFIAPVLIAVYGYFTLTGPRGIPGVLAKRQEIRVLEEKNADLVREIASKRERLRKLTSSESEKDLEIRRETQKIKDGDIEFMLPKAEAPAVPAP